jgi:hypothetical protein
MSYASDMAIGIVKSIARSKTAPLTYSVLIIDETRRHVRAAVLNASGHISIHFIVIKACRENLIPMGFAVKNSSWHRRGVTVPRCIRSNGSRTLP